MRRREFIAVLGGAAAAWPLTARAQQDGRVRRVGVLSSFADSDALYRAWWGALRQGLQQVGWIEGRSLRLDLAFGSAGDLVRMRAKAQELVKLAPDVMVVTGAAGTKALQELTRSIPDRKSTRLNSSH